MTANVQQTSSKLPANHVYFEYICWKLAERLLDRVNMLLMVIYAGDGYCRSEAIVAVYLQKKKSAKRIYATVVHSKTNSDGYKDRGIIKLSAS